MSAATFDCVETVHVLPTIGVSSRHCSLYAAEEVKQSSLLTFCRPGEVAQSRRLQHNKTSHGEAPKPQTAHLVSHIVATPPSSLHNDVMMFATLGWSVHPCKKPYHETVVISNLNSFDRLPQADTRATITHCCNPPLHHCTTMS